MFTSRREFRKGAEAAGLVLPAPVPPASLFVPAVIEPEPASAAPMPRKRRSRRSRTAAAVELEIDGIVAKIARCRCRRDRGGDRCLEDARMIGPGTAARVLVATRPVDFRKGADSLTALVKAEYGADPFLGVIYVFRAKRADRVKLIWWDWGTTFA